MDIDKFLVSLLFFVFTVFLFPTLNDQVAAATITSDIAPIIRVFPFLFLTISIVFPIYYGIKGDDGD